MKKNIIGLFYVAMLNAQNYDALLELAIQNNAQLQIAKSQGEQVKLQGQMTIRLENPNLEFELSDFSNRRLLRENQIGARVGASQSLLLPWVKENKKRLTQTQVEEQEQSFKLFKAQFIYRFNRLYILYKESVKQRELQQEALEISQRIVSIAKGRFEGGTVAKSELFQAQIEEQEILGELKSLELEILKRKNELLRFANLKTSLNIEAEHQFFETSSSSTHPLLILRDKKEEVAKAKLAVASNSIERLEVFSEMEAEPDQDVFRIGVSLPLPIFNDKSQEKQLAKIELNNQKLARESEQRALNLELEQLYQEIEREERLKAQYKALEEEQNRLLELYQRGYSIAKINILKLSNIKKELLITKKKLLSTKLSIEKNIIKINYIKGAYNE